MSDKNLLPKFVFVIVLILLAVWYLYPPQQKLKGGIDLVGGHSLLYEIDTAGLDRDQKVGLAERVMAVLKDRVDPQGQRNLEWRPIGNNRLEIRMPRPSKQAAERRKEYNRAMEAIRAKNIRSDALSAALHLEGAEREAALDRLAAGLASRAPLIDEVVATYDAWRAAMETNDPKQIEPAEEAFEEAQDKLMATNIDVPVLADVLAMDVGPERTKQLERFKSDYPGRKDLIEAARQRYEAWAEDKGTLEDPADLERLLRGAGVLEFRMVAEIDSATRTTILASDDYLKESIAKYVEQLAKRGPRPQPGDRYRWFKIANPVAYLNLEDRSELDDWEAVKARSPLVVEKYANAYYVLAHDTKRNTMLHSKRGERSWSLKQAFATRDPRKNRPAVDFTLDARGGQLFYELTSANIGRQLGIFLDDVAVSSATIQDAIRERGLISGDFTRERVAELVNKLEAGALPARLKEQPLMVKSVGPSLGAENIRRGLRSALWGTGAVIVFMTVYYLLAGVVANVALLMNLLLVLAAMAALEATMTLPGIAGLILTVGMTVDANVLIFERIREEGRRGASIRMAIKNGYEKAFSTIFDANLTTMISCVILGYMGTEEIKGFALTLGFGIATSMFTALFVTRMIFNAAVQVGVLKRLPMLSIPGLQTANFDWMRLWRYFWPVSAALLVGGFLAFDTQDPSHLYDIEFLGGTSAQLDLKKEVSLTDEDVRRRVTSTDPGGAAGWLMTAAEAIEQAEVQPAGRDSFTVRAAGLSPEATNTLLSTKVFAEITRRGGGVVIQGDGVRVATKAEAAVDSDKLQAKLAEVAEYVRGAASRLGRARVQLVGDIRGVAESGQSFEVVTVETDKKLVRQAIVAVMGEQLNIESAIGFADIADVHDRAHVFPVPLSARNLSDVIGGSWTFDVRQFRDGVVFVLEELDPPQTVDEITVRLRDMRLQPDFERYEWRDTRVVGLTRAGGGEGDQATFSQVAVLVVDPHIPYSDNAETWRTNLAEPELALITAALGTEKSLQKVLVFAPSVADQAKRQALVAIGLACLAMAVYLWFRFGAMEFGVAAIIALLHDVSIAVGLVAASHYVSQTAIGRLLMIQDFQIDLAMVAAFMTVLGYSVNDTIVVFDRIRENRGKLATVSPKVVNNSINQCLSRTVLTSVTTLIVVLIMYVMGGAGIHGFSYTLLVGILVGTYSSVAIASPLLLSRHLLRAAVYAVLTLAIFGFTLSLESVGWQVAMGVLSLVGAFAVVREVVLSRAARAPAPALAAAGR